MFFTYCQYTKNNDSMSKQVNVNFEGIIQVVEIKSLDPVIILRNVVAGHSAFEYHERTQWVYPTVDKDGKEVEAHVVKVEEIEYDKTGISFVAYVLPEDAMTPDEHEPFTVEVEMNVNGIELIKMSGC